MSRTSRGLSFAAALVAAAFVAAPRDARADFHFAGGVRWEALRLKHTGSDRTGAPGTGQTVFGLPDFQDRDLQPYLGIGITDQLQLMLGFDYARMTYDCGDSENDASQDDGVMCPGETDDNGDDPAFNYSHFGLELDAKYFFLAPRKEWIAPYVLVGVWKYFASVSDSEADDDQVEWVKDMASPWGFNLGLGVEYFFSQSFSLGAEVLGLRYGQAASSAVEDIAAKDRYIVLYTMLTLNFRFYGLFEVMTPEQRDLLKRNRPNPQELEPELEPAEKEGS